jgi:modification methylase
VADRTHTHVAAADSAATVEPLSASITVDATVRVSVLMVGQRSLATQRRGRFVAGSGAHPARMSPDLAAALICDYTRPGDWVLDPLAGVGTTLVEAIHAGRRRRPRPADHPPESCASQAVRTTHKPRQQRGMTRPR